MNYKKIFESNYFWNLGMLYLFLMESIALFYQYVLEELPCALCVQIRAWTLATLISVFIYQIFLKKIPVISHIGLLSIVGFLSGGLYTSYLAYGIEKGTIFSTCSIGSGFPTWLPLDTIIPALFEAKGLCGKSPDMFWGLTMSESLLFCFGVPIVVILFLYTMSKIKNNQQ